MAATRNGSAPAPSFLVLPDATTPYSKLGVPVDADNPLPVTGVIDGDSLINGVKDNGPQWTSVHGVLGVPFTSNDQSGGVASVTNAPTAGQKLVVTDLFVSVDTAMAVTFKCETSGAVVAGPFYLPANGTVQLTPRSKAWKLATADKKLQVVTSVSGKVMVDAHYYSEA